jgi:membrane protease YdiL (CAAX protease family)
MTMGSWLAREVAIIVVVVVVAVVVVRALFAVDFGAAIVVALAVVLVFMSISLFQWRKAGAEGERLGGGTPRAARRYTVDQYARLEPGMSVAEVDAVMGGGQSPESESDGNLVRQYANEDGSNVTVTFLDGSMSTKAMSGL